MKSIGSIIILLIFSFLTLSCEKEPYLIVSNNILNYTFPEQGGSEQITFSCNRDWTISTSESWIHCSPSSGLSSNKEIIITLSCDPNSTYEVRTAKILLTSDGISEIINISQEENLGLLVSPSIINISNNAQTIEIEVRNNIDYSISIDESCKDWIIQSNTKGLQTNILLFNIGANPTYDDREGKIHFIQNNDIITDVTILQKQLDKLFLYASTNNTLSFKEQPFVITALANVSFEILPNVDWIKVTETRGLQESTITLNLSENQTKEKRTGNVKFKSNSFEYQINFTQYGQPINLSSNGTANSYIVPLEDTFFNFDATIAGNDINHQYYNLDSGKKAAIIWQSSKDYSNNLIEDLEYDSGNINFRCNQTEGNALIGLFDENENIIWSWHLWLTNYNPEKDFITFSNGTILMDRYLGAYSPEEIGLYYQWGRKDPFMSGKYNYIKPDFNTGTVEYSISHPNIYLAGGNEITTWDWNCEHTSTWSSVKSVYDPSPPGWKVMDGAPFCLPKWPEGYVVIERDNYIVLGEPICTPSTKFRYTGLLHNSGHIQVTSNTLLIWTNYGSYHMFYDALEVKLNENGFIDNFSGRAYGECIRCQQE